MKFKKLLSSVIALAMSASMVIMPQVAEAADIVVYDSYTTSGAMDQLNINLNDIIESGETYEFSFNVKPQAVEVSNAVRIDLGHQGNVTSAGNYGIFYLYDNGKNALGKSDWGTIGNVSEYKDAVLADGIDMSMVWNTETGVVDITAGFPGKDYNYTYTPGVVAEGGSYGKFVIWSESTSVTVTDLVIKKQGYEEEKNEGYFLESHKTTGGGNAFHVSLDEQFETGKKYELSWNMIPDSIANQSIRADILWGNTASQGQFGFFLLYDGGVNALGMGNHGLIGNVADHTAEVVTKGVDFYMLWDTATGIADITVTFPTGKAYTYQYNAGIMGEGQKYGSLYLQGPHTAVTINDLSIKEWEEPVAEPDPDAPLYEKATWSISGEHNYIRVGSEIGMEAEGKYVIEFDVTAPTGNPSFYFDWRDYANVTKSNCASWNYKAIAGIYDDGDEDCLALGPAPSWVGLLARNGQTNQYKYTIVWDVPTSTFDMTLDYKKTSDGTTGTYTKTFTSTNAFRSDDVLKFATNSGTATIKNLKITNWKEPVIEPEPEPTVEDYYIASHTTTGKGNYLTIPLDGKMENGGKYELFWNFKPENLTDGDQTLRADVQGGSTSNQGQYGFFLLFDYGKKGLAMSDYNKMGDVSEHTADVVAEGIDVYMLWDTVAGSADITVTFPTGKSYSYTWNAGVVPEDGSFGNLVLQNVSGKAIITDLYIREIGEDKAPVLSPSNVKLYADDEFQPAAKVSAFTNKLVVDFGQRMKKADMTAENIYIAEKGSDVAVRGEFTYADGVVTINYADGFAACKTYTICVKSVRNAGGVNTVAYEKDFEVAGGVNAQLISVVQNGAEVTSASALNAGLATLKVFYSNTNDAVPVLHIISAFYKGGMLVKSDFFDWTPEDRNTISYEFNHTIPNVEFDEAQFMIWDGFSTLKPLSAPITLK